MILKISYRHDKNIKYQKLEHCIFCENRCFKKLSRLFEWLRRPIAFRSRASMRHLFCVYVNLFLKSKRPIVTIFWREESLGLEKSKLWSFWPAQPWGLMGGSNMQNRSNFESLLRSKVEKRQIHCNNVHETFFKNNVNYILNAW